jgi:ribosomal protein S18 acetylase RimI-like enzyme
VEEAELTGSPPPAVVVRRARIEDVEPVVRLWREMWELHTPLDPRFEISPAADVVMEKWIEDSLQGERAAVFVAESSPGLLLGYLHAMILENPPVVPHIFYGYVSEIAVHQRREGVGTRLLEAAHAWFREKRLPYVEVNVSIRNPIARGFWRKRGYSEFLERLRFDL